MFFIQDITETYSMILILTEKSCQQQYFVTFIIHTKTCIFFEFYDQHAALDSWHLIKILKGRFKAQKQ